MKKLIIIILFSAIKLFAGTVTVALAANVSYAMHDLKTMKKGAVIVDIAVDQGGCVETTKPTFHTNPVFVDDDVVHYCVANMPGAVALSSTLALTSVTNRYGIQLANFGVEAAIEKSEPLRTSLNVCKGKLVNAPVAQAHNMKYNEI